MLPTSRNTTYGANSPVLSADLDDIQDCIINGKHALRTFQYAAASFRGLGPGGGLQGNSTFYPDPGGDSLCVGIPQIPIGDRIVNVSFSYNRGNAGRIDYSLYRRPTAPVGAGLGTQIATAFDTVTNGDVTQNLLAINHTVAPGFFYFLCVFFNGAAAVVPSWVYGATVDSDKL